MHDHHKRNLRDFILGWQDGLVNVLGVILVVATATHDLRVILISGLAATFAESLSMAAVAYTSSKAAQDYWKGEMLEERREIERAPAHGRAELWQIYRRKGFSGALLEQIVRKLSSNKKLMAQTIITERLKVSPEEYQRPARNGAVVGLSAVVGSLIPLVPFLAAPVDTAVALSVILATLVLFTVGAVKAEVTIGSWQRSGAELAVVGMSAALIGYGIGLLLGVVV